MNKNESNRDHNKIRLAERCVKANKTPIFLKEVYAFLNERMYIEPDEIKPGMQLTIICRSIKTKKDGMRQNDCDMDVPTHWEIPSVVNVEWIQDHLVIESRTYMFSTLNFADEYNRGIPIL